MSGVAVHFGDTVVSWAALLVGIAVAQWLILAIISMASRARAPKEGLRGADRNLIFGSVLFAALWIIAFGSFGKSAHAAADASAAAKPQGACSSVNTGMTSAEVQKRLGVPDEKRNDEDTRGPSATMWIYRGSRCVVHIFGDQVEFID